MTVSHAVAALFALVLAAARSEAQELLWPVHSNAAPRVSQAFGEFGDGSSTKYHAGLDLAVVVGTDVFPVAEGELAFVQRVSPNGLDHGFGNTVILLHRPPAKPRFFSQYSHLSSIEDKLLNACKPNRDRSKIETPLTCVTGATWTTEQAIGKSGHSASGLQESPKIPPHLHLEIKTFGTLCASIPNEPGCGYATVQPWTIGYSDPVDGLVGVQPFEAPFPVVVRGSGVSVRFTPDAGAGKRAITTLGRDGAMTLRAVGWSGGYPPCEREGWIQVRRADDRNCPGASGANSCFADSLDPEITAPNKYLGLVPTAWICAKYLAPEKTTDTGRAVTEGTLLAGGSVSVKPAGAKPFTVELADRDGLFTVYEMAQAPSAAADLWSVIFLDSAPANPTLLDNNSELVTALLSRFAAGCPTASDASGRAKCAVERLAATWRVRIGGGRYDEGQRCVAWRDTARAKPECRPY